VTSARNEPPATLRRLLPSPTPSDGSAVGGAQAATLTPDELASSLDFGDRAPDGRPFVAVNMVSTVDGRASVAGRTAPISSVADRQLFHALRTRVDAVMVGAGTVRAERYGRLVRDPHRREQRVAAGLAADPLAIVVSGRLDLSCELPLLADSASHVVVITASEASIDGCAARVEYLRSSPVDLVTALTRLRAEHGVRSILCEGGPSLNASLLAGELVDELFLTTVGKLAGGAGALTIMGDAPIDEPAGARLQSLCECDGELFARYALDG
jgi:riboflavin-specific deaminase-like protein